MPSKPKIIEVHIPSVIGYEKVAMDSGAAVARIMGFHPGRVEDLKTAISEACTNAMEHGNRLRRDTKVLVTLKMTKGSLEVKVKDEGKGVPRRLRKPRLESQLNAKEEARGWGMFLIKNLVDEVEFENIPDGGNVIRMVIHVGR